jgi:hypothetical protein
LARLCGAAVVVVIVGAAAAAEGGTTNTVNGIAVADCAATSDPEPL